MVDRRFIVYSERASDFEDFEDLRDLHTVCVDLGEKKQWIAN